MFCNRFFLAIFFVKWFSGNLFCEMVFSCTQVRVMESLEGGKLVTRHWVRWNKEDGKEVPIDPIIMPFVING